jgi:hypothetical protein
MHFLARFRFLGELLRASKITQTRFIARHS